MHELESRLMIAKCWGRRNGEWLLREMGFPFRK